VDTVGIHPTSVIHPETRLEKNVTVGPYAVIGPKVTLRHGASIGAHAIVEYAEVGSRCQIYPHAFVGTAPQDLNYHGEESGVIVGDETVVRECATVHRSNHEGGLTTIGQRCMLMAYSHVAHDCTLGNAVIMANYTGLAGHVTIGDSAFLSGHIGVHQFVRIGKFVMISAGSMVGQDIPPFCTAQGDRASLFGLNLVGLRRAGLKSSDVSLLKTAYKTLFLSGLTLESALEKLKLESNENVKHLVDFIQVSKRGVCRPLKNSAEDVQTLNRSEASEPA